MKPAKSMPPNCSCSFASSFEMSAKTNETKNAKSNRSRKWLCTLLAAKRDVVGVDDDQQIQKSGHDQEGVAVLVADRAHVTHAEAQ